MSGELKMIKYLVLDVDGTLTDGKIYMGQDGEVFKAFNIKDGCGIKEILPHLGIVPIVITARSSKILENRCNEIGITEVHQGFRKKLEKLEAIIHEKGANYKEVAYIGDDIPDVSCMEKIKNSGGIVMSPSDAITEVKVLADYISGYKAGEGAVRDCINYLIQKSEKIDMEDRIQKVIDMILKGDYIDQPNGVLKDGSKYTIQEYVTKEESECVLEIHRKHIDVFYMIEGCEEVKTYSNIGLAGKSDYSVDKDVEYWQDGIVSTQSVLCPGSIMVIYNNQPHKGAIVFGSPSKVKKLVCKIRLE